MRGSLSEFLNLDFGLRNQKRGIAFSNPHSEFRMPHAAMSIDTKTRSERRMPRPLNYKKSGCFSSNFFGITPAPQYSLNLPTKPTSVKSPRQKSGVISLGCRVKFPPTDSRLQTHDSRLPTTIYLTST